MSEGDVPVRAGDEQHEENTQPDRRILGQEQQQPRHNQRNDHEVAREHRPHEAPVAERLRQMDQRHLREGHENQDAEKRPERRLEMCGGPRQHQTQAQPCQDGGKIDPDLLPLKIEARHSEILSVRIG